MAAAAPAGGHAGDPHGPPVQCTHLVASHWAHLASGGRHIVFTYLGDDPQWVGRALRLVLMHKAEDPETAKREATEARRWVREDMLPLFQLPRVVDDAVEVRLSQRQAAQLTQMGRDKNGRHLVCPLYPDHAELLPDYSAGCDILVELKPKMGCLWPQCEVWAGGRSAEHWIGDVDPLKQHCSRYCMQQVMKFEGRHVGLVTDYDPTDLFSGDSPRVYSAVRALFDVPQNNMALLRQGAKVAVGELPGAERDRLAQAVVGALESSGVLPALLRAQTVTPVDPAQMAAAPRGCGEVYVAATEWPVGRRSLARDIVRGAPWPAEVLDAGRLPARPAPPDAVRTTWAALARDFQRSRSAQDCSLMVMLRKAPSGELVYGDNSVRVIDLDLKPIKKLDHWAQQDAAIGRFFRRLYAPGAPLSPAPPVHVDAAAVAEGANVIPEHWAFFTAGSHHCMFSYSGTDERWAGRLLRAALVQPLMSLEQVREEELRALSWVKDAMLPLLGDSSLVDIGEVVSCSPETARALQDRARDQRGRSVMVPLAHNHIGVLPDYHSRCDVMLELKPKLGSLCPEVEVWAGGTGAEHWVGAVDPIKRVCSRYSMKQEWKLQNGRVSELTEYDPTDLFSGCEERVSAAVDALFAVPHHNLRVHRHRAEVPVCELQPAERSALAAGLVQALHQSGVLPALLRAQTVSPIDPTQAARVPGDTEHIWVLAEPWPRGERSRAADVQRGTPLSSLPGLGRGDRLPSARPAPPGARRLRWADVFFDYLRARCAQDCSVLVLLRGSGEGPYTSAGVKVIDADVRPVSYTAYWAEQDQVACDSFRERHRLQRHRSGRHWGEWRNLAGTREGRSSSDLLRGRTQSG
eukprot:TRINITY_DN34069_c0_g1_i2.p1 TRINITY_DN34069_c0_g1~~TRINITY_DN34069_c0_g1_i2.p1  ORF type:complete len:900 (+),score=238.61 TRINITY_DN34069_c0_g1_i2:121-2700(+)